MRDRSSPTTTSRRRTGLTTLEAIDRGLAVAPDLSGLVPRIGAPLDHPREVVGVLPLPRRAVIRNDHVEDVIFGVEAEREPGPRRGEVDVPVGESAGVPSSDHPERIARTVHMHGRALRGRITMRTVPLQQIPAVRPAPRATTPLTNRADRLEQHGHRRVIRDDGRREAVPAHAAGTAPNDNDTTARPRHGIDLTDPCRVAGRMRCGAEGPGAAGGRPETFLRRQLCAWIEPNSPWLSPSGPAVKNNVFIGPAAAPLPNCSAHSPGITIGLPFSRCRLPSCMNSPLDSGSKTLIMPSPKLPISRWPLALPKLLGAHAIPHGASSEPMDATRWRSLPDRLYISTKPKPAPATSSSAAASCLAYVTKMRLPIVWMPNGA